MGALRDWYRDHQRDLPWRHPEVTPWGIVVSEVMLQQTPVARVIPAWLSWMDRWPSPEDLAAASLGDVLVHWNRLGYPRRAKNLHHTATLIVTQHHGEVPQTLPELLALPGIGDYTARAIACFAFGQPHPVVDTNVKRVVARAFDGQAAAGNWSVGHGIERVGNAMDTPLSDADYCLTQRALMELGALVCQARNPSCEQCPLSKHCAWKASGFPVDHTVLPRKQARYEGSDRQVRGLILEFLRNNAGTHSEGEISVVWPGKAQFRRALRSLVTDGLVEEHSEGAEPQFGLSWLPLPDRGE